MAKEKVVDNVDQLLDFNHSMAVALSMAKTGSTVEDGYFLEKLEESANRLGYVLVDDLP